jgi:hypothetical protein
MINNLKTVSADELKAQIDYLRNTPVAQFADALESRNCVLKTGTITDVEWLGNQKTIFGELGSVFSNKIYNQDKFLVNQVWSVLNRTDCTDSKSRDAISGIKTALETQTLIPNITFFSSDIDVIIDGNKTVSAFYELHRSENKLISLDVFAVLQADQSNLVGI